MKKTIVYILISILLLSTLISPTYAEGEETVENTEKLFVRVDGDKTIVGKPGDDFSIGVNCYVRGAKVGSIISGTADASDNSNIYLLSAFDQRELSGKSFDFMTGEDRVYMSFSGRIPEDAKSGTYAVNISISIDGTELAKHIAYIRVEGEDNVETSLTMSEVRLIPNTSDIEPGAPVIIGLEVLNDGEKPAKNVSIKLEGLTADGFALVEGFDTKKIDYIGPHEKKRIVYQVASLPNAKPGNYEFTITLNSNNKKAEEKDTSVQRKFYLTLGGNPDKASALLIENLKYPTKTLYPGNVATLTFDVTNKGQSVAKRVMIKSQVEGTGLVNRSISQHFIEALNPGETKSFEFKYYATPASLTQNYPITIKVEYFDQYTKEDTPSVTEQVAGIFVSNPEKDNEEDGKKKTTPKLIIDKYEFDPKLPEAGEEFKMKLSFFNTNSKRTVKNIKIFLTSQDTTKQDSLTSGSNIFTPVDSSNTFYIDQIPPKQSVEKDITLYTVPDATAKTYTVTANFEYEDDTNTEYKATEEIGIPVVQSSKLEIGEVQFNQNMFAGESAPVNVEFYNTGKVTLYNMMVKFESEDFDAQNSTYYIGNFVEGSTESYEVYLTAQEPGEKTGNIVFTYEDSSGEKQEVKKEIKIQVEEGAPVDPTMQDPNMGPDGEFPGMEDNEGGFKGFIKSAIKKWYTWVIIAAAVIGGGYAIKKSRDKKREKELSLDD